MSVYFKAACNRVAQPCGCATWDELVDGEWVRKSALCNRHEIAAARAAREAC